MKNLTRSKLLCQKLLFPIVAELSPAEFYTFENNQDLFEKIGFETKPFGGRSILLTGIPSLVKNKNEEHLFREILFDLEENLKGGKDRFRAITMSFACKAAIKAGDKLSIEEMNSLIEKLFSTPNPYFCPHGRPTLIRIPLSELDKRFKRT
jgi:DNA mismatch repair protein MutL